jgi:CMD domain protein
MSNDDVIDRLAGLAAGSPLAMIRDRKPVTRQQAQESFRALFEAGEAGDVTVRERFALARFVAGLHVQEEAFVAALSGEIVNGRTIGPYGAYPKGPLSVEDVAGLTYAVTEQNRSVLGVRMSAAMAHVHLLVFHPRDATSSGLQRLLDAGWSNAGIVTLSQLVAFLAFQIRAAAGLRTLAASA